MSDETTEIKAYDRQSDEKEHHYLWFHRYLMMGSSRSLLGAYNAYQADKGGSKRTKTPGAWDVVFTNNRWKERAAVWDAEQRKIVERQYAEKRDKLLNKRINVAEQLLDKAEMMLRFPIVETKNAGGTTIIEPGKWTFDTAARLVAAADKLLEETNETTIKVTEKRGSDVSADARPVLTITINGTPTMAEAGDGAAIEGN